MRIRWQRIYCPYSLKPKYSHSITQHSKRRSYINPPTPNPPIPNTQAHTRTHTHRCTAKHTKYSHTRTHAHRDMKKPSLTHTDTPTHPHTHTGMLTPKQIYTLTHPMRGLKLGKLQESATLKRHGNHVDPVAEDPLPILPCIHRHSNS